MLLNVKNLNERLSRGSEIASGSQIVHVTFKRLR